MSENIKLKDIKEAFRKLQSSIYYENNNLSLRYELAQFIVGDDISIDDKLGAIKKRIDLGDNFVEELDKIGLQYYPKKISSHSEDKFPSNFITNNFITNKINIKRYALFCEMSIELHLIAVLWVMKYGYLLDKNLDECCMGNRLILDEQKDEIVNGKSFYKPYVNQYKKWWSNAIKKAQQLFEEKSDVTIVNFDLKNYYHSVQLDFDLIENEIGNDIKEAHLHKLFKSIHQRYYDIIKSKNDNMFELVENKYPLPIGILSSSVLANWYLNEFDKSIEDLLNPAFYARYVDDIIIVLKNSMINSLPNKKI